jgi:putative addiction module component (TIGR02574 family)
MTRTEEIIEQAVSLPEDDRIRVVDALLTSLNQPDPETEREWAAVAQRRFHELRSGKAVGVSADEVFAKLNARFPAQ